MPHQVPNPNNPLPWWGYGVILFTYLIAFKVFFPSVVKVQLHAIDYFFAPMDLIHSSMSFDLLPIILIITSTFLAFLAPLGFALFIIKELRENY
ncbi:hypothetical protein QDR63_01505 [Acinetobacter baumannii]|uniref:hypothetical protein n=1 Tax=Acinetobacter baumannii TaxID=470 RepID=UPI00244CEDB5|nr:hypothetical protein [Acinetobacter baumannii]MDH2524973.1 hypothetical protein [Acinetobacter baumannii]